MKTIESKVITFHRDNEKAEAGLLVSGEVFINGNRALFGTQITLYENEKEIQRYTCCLSGTFYFLLDYNKNYIIIVSKNGFENKSVEFNTQIGGHELKRRYYDFGITLNPSPESDHASSDHKPAAKVRFLNETETFEHDREYHEQRILSQHVA